MTSLTRYQRFDQDGLELVIDTTTGESYATVSGYARMSGLSQPAISKRVQKLHNQNLIKTAQIQTGYGVKLHNLISESIISDWIIDDNPKLAKQMLRAGVRVFLYGVAGYQVKASEPETPKTRLVRDVEWRADRSDGKVTQTKTRPSPDETWPGFGFLLTTAPNPR